MSLRNISSVVWRATLMAAVLLGCAAGAPAESPRGEPEHAAETKSAVGRGVKVGEPVVIVPEALKRKKPMGPSPYYRSKHDPPAPSPSMRARQADFLSRGQSLRLLFGPESQEFAKAYAELKSAMLGAAE